MTIPKWFEEELDSQFNGRLRVRWSHQAQQYFIEQKIGRRKLPRKRTSEWDDRAIQYKDGFEFVLSVTPGDRTKCPACGQDTHVPVMAMRFAKCEWCGKEFRACYWPLGDGLLQWLRYTDPYRDGLDRMMRDLEQADAQRELGLTRKARNEREATLRDNFTRLFEIQSVGYTGRESAWIQ